MPALSPTAARAVRRATVVLILAYPTLSLAVQTQAPRTGSAGRAGLARADAVSMRAKVAAIERQGLAANASKAPAPTSKGSASAARPPAPTPTPTPTLTTRITESEVNAYLAYDKDVQIPVGIAQPNIRILGDRRLAGTALVDLDAVRAHHRSTGWLDPMAYLTGQLPVAVSGRLSSGSGVAWFELDSATISGIPIPKTLLQELVSYYSRTPANPRGLNIDDPFVLPAGIRQIDIRRGEALIVQ